MPLTYTELGSEDFGVGAPTDDPVFQALETNDEAAIDHVTQVHIPETIIVPGATYTVIYSFDLEILNGTITLGLTFESWNSGAGGNTISLKATIAGAVDSNELTFTSTTPTYRTLTFSNVAAYRDTRALIEIKVKASGGDAVSINSQNVAGIRQSYAA